MARLKASFYTLGCRLNQAETALIANRFREHGYEVVDFRQPSDVCVINSCTVTEQADARCRQVVRQILRRNPDTYVAVIGCYAQTGSEALSRIEGVDLIVGTQEKLRVLDFISEPIKRPEPEIIRSPMTRAPFTIDSSRGQAFTTRANLKIQDGCDFMCSFCVIPFARGRARSRAFWDIQREAIGLVEAGHKELVLTGVNIGTYQYERNSFLDVVHMLLAIPGLQRLRISSIEPTTIPVALLDLMRNDPRLCPHLHIPVQSGSNRVLERMRRKYTREMFLSFIDEVKARVPDALIATDLMVGFPGEQEADFQASCDLLQNSPLAYAHVFTFSARSHTAAMRMPDHVDPATKKARSRYLHQLSEAKRQQFYAGHIGRQVRVLTEEQDAGGRWLGYTDNYIKVAFESPHLRANQFVSVLIEGIDKGVAQGRLLSAQVSKSGALLPETFSEAA